MNNRDLFVKDPLGWKILNEGITSNNVTDEETLRYELSNFVCEGEYLEGLSRILDGFLGNLGSDQKSVWVSGFYGSGKSHLVKVLRYLWTDTPFADGTTARSLAHLPEDISNKLKELSNQAKKLKVPLVAAGGTLRSATGTVPIRLLKIVFHSLGIPEDISSARLWLDLRHDGKLDQVLESIKSAKKDPEDQFDKIYTSTALHKAYQQAYPDAGSLETIIKSIQSQYPPKVENISIPDMIKLLRRALSDDPKKLPLTVIVLDEVQQYINNNADIANEVQEAVEACSKDMDGRVLFVGTGQSALSETPSLQKLMARFTIKVPLKDTDVQTVVRRVVLQKKDEQKANLSRELDNRSGEISSQLKSTRLATKPDDADSHVTDYPLLPVRRRFWEKVLHHVDSTGTTAQMRTQLRVVHEACREVADKPIGTVISGDFIYDQLAAELIQTGELQKRFSEIIEEQKNKPEGALRRRVCALVYLINKLPRTGSDVDDGVRAHANHLADLLSDNLLTGSGELRQKLPTLLDALVADGVLMKVDDEYRLQTTEGANWESTYRQRRTATLNNDALLATSRGKALQEVIQQQCGGITLTHGLSKVGRKVSLHTGQSAPSVSDGLVVWVRDGYSESETSVKKDIQARPQDDPTIHVFIPKGNDLREVLSEWIATQETMNHKGYPSTSEGQEARRAMESRHASAADRLKDMVNKIFDHARVYVSGGTEITASTPKEAVMEAAGKVVNRLYPRFGDADHGSWPTVFKRAKEGNGSPLEPVGHKSEADKHPVAMEIIKRIAGGLKGSELVKDLDAPPYGWPKDAVVSTVAALCATGHVKVEYQNRELTASELDATKVGQATLRRQHPVLTVSQMLKVRGVFQTAGLNISAGQEATTANSLVEKLKQLAAGAGGEAPAPVAPQPPLLTELAGLTGNDLLFKLYEHHESLTTSINQWLATAKKLKPRLAMYHDSHFLLGHARALPEAASLAALLDAVVKARSLLDDPDPVAPVHKQINNLLLQAIKQADDTLAAVYKRELTQIEAHPLWQTLAPSRQSELLAAAGVVAPVPTDPQRPLRDILTAQNLQGRSTLAEALPTQFQKALNQAILDAEPKAVKVSLPPGTLKTEPEVEAWLAKAREVLLSRLKQGPVIVG